jgi:hypothetical protein
MYRILAITATLLGLASAAHADVYRWKDAKGTIQYSDRWVPGSELVKTDSRRPTAPPPPSAPSAPSRPGETSAAAEDQRTVAQDVAKSKAEQCKQAREAYDKAVQSRRIYKEGKDGAREYISDAEAEQYRLTLLNARKLTCGS